MKNTIFKYILLLLIVSIGSVVIGEAQNLTVERIHVHLQKNVYMAGEAIQFKLYCIDAKDQKLSNNSQVAYVELIGESGFPVAQTDVILKHGMGEGGFIISGQLPTGNYAINAYTYWMKTSSPDFINVSSLFIYNNQNLNGDTNPQTNIHDCNFRDLKNNEINLVGSTPETKEENDDEITIDTKIEDLNRILRFSVSSKQAGSKTKVPYHFVIYSKQGIILNKEFYFNNGNYELLLKIKDFKQTNYSICIRDKENKILKTAVVHLAKSNRGRFIEKPRITTPKRKKNKIKLQLEEFTKQTDSLFLSASIKLKEPYNPSTNIVDYMNLYSDFGATMLPYFDQLRQIGKQNWIGGNGLQTLWLNSSNTYSVNANRYPEKDAYVLEGKVNDRNTKHPFANENIFLSRIGAYADISTFCTDNEGRFFFNLPLKKGLHDISIQIAGKDNLDLSIKLKEKFNTEGIAPLSWDPKQLKGDQLAYIKQLFENFRIRAIYQQKTYEKTKDTCLYRGESNFFGKPTHSIHIDDYIRLDSLEEYFHEFVSTVKIKYRKNKPYMNVFSPEIVRVFKQAPLLMYDGLILSDASTILNKNSKEIDKIEVVPFEYFYGSSHMYGIINVISKTQDCELNQLPKNTERYYLPLFTNGVEFIDHNVPLKTHHADYRTDLLWEPDIILTKDKNFELEFTSSGVKGEYELTVEGITEDGEPIVLKQSIWVE